MKTIIGLNDSLPSLIAAQNVINGEDKDGNATGDQGSHKIDAKVTSNSVLDFCKLYGSETLEKMMEQIKYYGNKKRPSAEMLAGVEVDPEYCLIVEANTLAVEIDNEICKLFDFSLLNSVLIRYIYAQLF